MAVDVSLTPIVSGYNITKINNNFTATETALLDAVSRSGNGPNTMSADFDMNGNDILNADTISANVLYLAGVGFSTSTALTKGDKGWSYKLALVSDGSRRVLQIVDYVGGAGTKPTADINSYLGSSGPVVSIASATDIRGATGAGTGDVLAANNLSDLSNLTTARSNLSLGNVDNTSDINKPVSTATTAAINLAQTQQASIAGRNGNDTLILTDAGGFIYNTSSTDCTLTVPPNSSVAFPIKTRIDIAQSGAGKVTVTPGSGVSIISAGSKYKLNTMFSGATLLKYGTDSWWLFGDLV